MKQVRHMAMGEAEKGRGAQAAQEGTREKMFNSLRYTHYDAIVIQGAILRIVNFWTSRCGTTYLFNVYISDSAKFASWDLEENKTVCTNLSFVANVYR